MEAKYQRNSYNGFRAALNRHLEDRGFDLFNDPQFVRSNNVFDGVWKKLKREGKLRPVKHKDPISDTDMQKISYMFGVHKDPVTLLQQVWFFCDSVLWTACTGSSGNDEEE